MPNKSSNTNSQNSIIKKYQKTNPINIKNKNNNIKEKIDEKNKPKIDIITLSPHKISLFDLRYPSLPKTEKVLNINYKELSVKKNQ